MSWDKKRDLAEIQAQGKECLRQYDEHGRAMAKAQAEILKLEREVVSIDAQAAEWVHRKPQPEDFATDDEIAHWQEKLDSLMAQRAELMNQRRNLTAIVCQQRLTMIRLGKQIDALRYSQQNLQGVAHGDKVGGGWEGGVFPVSG